LVNPPIYDFTAFDFWLKPYGLLSVAGYLRGRADFTLFDYLDRLHPFCAGQKGLASDKWGRGRFYEEKMPHPESLKQIPRYFRRFGLPRSIFQDFLAQDKSCDFVFINTVMTYWYLGVREVIEDVRRFQPGAKIVLGGNYVTLCRPHAETIGADFLVEGKYLSPLWEYTGLESDTNQPALWEAYPRSAVGVLKLSDGCPFRCTYCSVPKVYGAFQPRPLGQCLAELELLLKLGASDIAFYDDTLLYDAENVLIPFLNEVVKRKITVKFHSPNALNARFLTKELAKLMVRAGFKTFYLGFESGSRKWQEKTGSKVFSDELAKAVEYLTQAGAERGNIAAYQILGHPDGDIQQLEESMRFVNRLGIRGTLADFSPIPGTPDGDRCGKWVDMAEPLFHNKTVFPILFLGFDETNRLKDLQRHLNRSVG